MRRASALARRALAKTYGAFMQAMQSNTRTQRVWATVAVVESFVLFWHQFCVPLIVALVRLWHPGFSYPSSGTTVDWSYVLIALCLGT
jgi:hypothetical protein